MVLHNRVQPFAKKSNNILMSLALAVLLFIAIMNLLKAGYFESGEIPQETADAILRVRVCERGMRAQGWVLRVRRDPAGDGRHHTEGVCV